MSEESVLILNMLREGKVTAEQADSLLRAVRENAAPTPPAAPPPPPAPPEPDSAAIDAMQAKLSDLQGKLGDLQGKLGAAQTAKTVDYASALAGKLLDTLPKPELDMSKINKAVDEAMRGLNSLKNDALKTARTAARQAAHEARRAGREGRHGFKFDFNFDFDGDSAAGRPQNDDSAAQAAQTSHETLAWTGADILALENHYGSISIFGADLPEGTAEAAVTKTAWAESESEARVLLQQVFLTNQVENGRCKVGIAAPRDDAKRLTVDYEIRVPRTAALEVSTTFGMVSAQGTSAALTVQTMSGKVQASDPFAAAPGDLRLASHSGAIFLKNWSAKTSRIAVETTSASVNAADISGASVQLTSRSGDMEARSVQAASDALFESTSGDVRVSEARASRVHIRTQSGQASLTDSQAEQIQMETVSGDATLRGVGGALTVKTISGDVDAADADSPAISLVTVSGDAHWAAPSAFAGAFAGTTVSGDLRLILPPGSDARVEMNTTSGTLSLLPVSGAVTTERHAAGTLGAGAGSVRLQSVSGDLTVSEAG